MALKEVKIREYDKEPVALTALEIGEAVDGYFVETAKSIHANGGDNLVFRDKETGETFPVYSAGNIRALLQGDDYKFGAYTVITRIDDKMVNGRKSTQYKMQQDADDMNPWLNKSVSAGTNTADSKQLI